MRLRKVETMTVSLIDHCHCHLKKDEKGKIRKNTEKYRKKGYFGVLGFTVRKRETGKDKNQASLQTTKLR